MLAEQPAHTLPTQLSPLTPHTITDRDDLLEDLDKTRQRGYSIDLEENTMGLRCYGMALHYTAPARDSISCSIPLARITPELEKTCLLYTSDAADE